MTQPRHHNHFAAASHATTTSEPHVGIFWMLAFADHPALLGHRVPLAQGEPYGDFLTHGAHYEHWTALAALGTDELLRRGLLTTPAWSEYEEWPRGRVIFHRPTQRFVIYADRKIQHASAIALIRANFGVPDGAFDVRSDEHYVSIRDVPHGPP
ncbi:hypothetical protein [Roseomonas haemaphysalidis]|uniref:Uncharacterized protein n=1 Tax=Roseomonas haemaphysalidis TaxID=2768162 RepID=A0ABS3KW64_9PROT|nr:hypothetical protein [Roseomonas haemaphysalidis]MBO1081679.1 hypothetical protein [Roseomonas haemaphysalidis]